MTKIITMLAAVASISIGSVSFAESKSAGEWLRQIEAEAAEAKPDPEMEKLEFGAVMHSYRGWVPKGDQIPGWNAFEKFWEERGRALREKLFRGEEFSADEAKYELLIRCVAVGPHDKPEAKRGNIASSLVNDFELCGLNPNPKGLYERYTLSTIYLGRMALRKGFSGLPLNEDDIKALQDYNFLTYQNSGGAQYGPQKLKLMKTTAYQPGSALPNFYIKRLDAVLNDPAFSDLDVDEWNWTDRIQPIGIKLFLQKMDGYYSEINDDGRLIAHPRAAADGWADDNDNSFVRLADLCGNKPVVILKFGSKDTCWTVRWTPGVESVYQAYKDKVDFYFLTGGGDGSDFWPQKTYYGKSLDDPPGDYFTRASGVKAGYMRHPNVTIPGLLDNDAGSVTDVLDRTLTILDIDGKVAYDSPKGNVALYGGGEDEIYFLNELEYEIRALLNNGGKCDPSRGKQYRNEIRSEMAQRSKDGVIDKRTGKMQHFIPYHQYPSGTSWAYPIWFSGRITALDSEAGQLTVRLEIEPEEKMIGYQFNRKDKKKITLGPWAEMNQKILEKWVHGNDKDRTYVFDVTDETELFLNGLKTQMGQFRVGDRIGGRIPFFPDAVKKAVQDPANPDSKNYNIPNMTTTPEGYTRVEPDHLRVSRPVEKGAWQFVREKAMKADDITKVRERMQKKREAKKNAENK